MATPTPKTSAPKTPAPETPAPGPRPCWIPADLDFDALSPELRNAVAAIVDPAYDELVLQAQTAIERASGLSYVHLLWLELIEQLDLARDMALSLPRGQGTGDHQEKLLRHLRLVAQKDKVAKFLLAVQQFYHRAGEKDPLGRLPR